MKIIYTIMQNKTYFIYILRNPITEAIFYVGKTTNPKKRLIDHIGCKVNKNKYNYIQSFKITPIMEILETCNVGEEASEKEVYHIKKLTEEGHNLFNYGCNEPKKEKPLSTKIILPPDVYEMAFLAAKARLIPIGKLIELALIKHYI